MDVLIIASVKLCWKKNMTELYRTEHYVLAANRGMSHAGDTEVVTCAAWASKYNELGNILARLIGSVDYSKKTYNGFYYEQALRVIISQLSDKIRSVDKFDIANDALGYFVFPWCLLCHGAEALDVYQTQCPACNGARFRVKPEGKAEGVISELHAAIDYFELQVSARMSGYHAPQQEAKALKHFRVENVHECGSYIIPMRD